MGNTKGSQDLAFDFRVDELSRRRDKGKDFGLQLLLERSWVIDVWNDISGRSPELQRLVHTVKGEQLLVLPHPDPGIELTRVTLLVRKRTRYLPEYRSGSMRHCLIV